MRILEDLHSRIESFETPDNIIVLGPAPAVLGKIRERYRHQLMIKAADAKNIRAIILQLREFKSPRNVKLIIDVDPLNFL